MTEVIKCKKVAIALLGYNSRDYLGRFIPSLLNSTYDDFDIVFIDNGSQDDSVDLVKTRFPTVKIFKVAHNRGFTNGYVESLRYIDAPYYVILNSDVEVSPNWIGPIVGLMDKTPEIAAAQPKILHYDNKSNFDYAGASGGFIDRYGYPFCRGRIFDELESDKGQYDDQMEIFWATGACLFIRSEVYHRLGGFDNDFYAHMEEIDLCWRIKNAGFQIKVCPESVVYHVGGSIIKYGSYEKLYRNYRNNLIMMLKNLPENELLFTLLFRLMLDGVALARALVSLRFVEFSAILAAVANFILKFPRWWAHRKAAEKLIGKRNTDGIYPRSIVFDYFLKGVKKFSDLPRAMNDE